MFDIPVMKPNSYTTFSGSCENSDSYLSDKKPWKNKNPVKMSSVVSLHTWFDMLLNAIVVTGYKIS